MVLLIITTVRYRIRIGILKQYNKLYNWLDNIGYKIQVIYNAMNVICRGASIISGKLFIQI